jgi:hypothetical protein
VFEGVDRCRSNLSNLLVKIFNRNKVGGINSHRHALVQGKEEGSL